MVSGQSKGHGPVVRIKLGHVFRSTRWKGSQISGVYGHWGNSSGIRGKRVRFGLAPIGRLEYGPGRWLTFPLIGTRAAKVGANS